MNMLPGVFPPDFQIRTVLGFKPYRDPKLDEILRPDERTKAHLLFDHCIATGKVAPDNVHSLLVLAEHYASDAPEDVGKPEVIDGIPELFHTLSNEHKSRFCYIKVIEALVVEAKPVTVDSLLATTRSVPSDPTTSVAGRFVQRVARFVIWTLLFILGFYLFYLGWNWLKPFGMQIPAGSDALKFMTWGLFGCVGALLHLLNHALTTTRLQTFEISEERKIGPRILLGGMFGFVVPWLFETPGAIGQGQAVPMGNVAAFFGGYSVRFAVGFLERVLSALMPETDKKT